MTEDELRDLVERNAQVQELAAHPGWLLLADYVRAQTEAKQRWLLVGNADTIEKYREVTGWLKGVADVLGAPKTLAEQVQRAQQEANK